MTRQKLVAAARERFEAVGYANTSADDITALAGASRATFYLHFGGKADVLAEIVSEVHIAPVIKLVESLGELDDITVDSLRQWLVEFSGIYRRTRKIMRAWVQAGGREGGQLIGIADGMRDTFLDVMSARVAAIREKGNLPVDPEDARLRSLLMFVQIERFCYYVYLRNLRFDLDAGLDLIASQWYATLTGEGTAR
ncbi:TetR/AcrR family transcriptional regulator [Streptomyces sp. NPDC051985]|uniref:TetR/AcrR family transcriptional regulator n=1 Tax=Streptomyces sp. NPDC051985 TaxID=3155807 RepID=UPI0034235FED